MLARSRATGNGRAASRDFRQVVSMTLGTGL